jgi:hypothetical protein
MTNLKGFGRKRSSPNGASFRHLPGGTEESLRPGRDSNRTLPQCKLPLDQPIRYIVVRIKGTPFDAFYSVSSFVNFKYEVAVSELGLV